MFSKELELSIASLFDKAHEANIQYITVEHLLLMILNDYDVKDCLETNNIHIETLKNSIEEHLKKNTVTRIDQSKSVQPTLGFQRVLQRAVFHIQSSGKGVVKPINILVAIFSEKESHSVFLLNKNNLNRLAVVSYISHGATKKKDDAQVDEDQEVRETSSNSKESNYLINLNNLVAIGAAVVLPDPPCSTIMLRA